jgi:aspartyl-tRNA synthetase
MTEQTNSNINPESQFWGVPRSCYCGELRASDIGREVVLKGWVLRRRDLGGLIFIDLRDREGLCQVVFSPDVLSPEQFEQASKIKMEYVLAIRGKVHPRPEGGTNPNLETGEVEVHARTYEILNTSTPLPFRLDEYIPVSDDMRLKYRYLDLRRREVQNNIMFRSRLYKVVRDYFAGHGFIEVETPILTKSTPEGARDFLVPSRINPGDFYALPQSPQLFKQILMIAGFDRYIQIARCFRDEDLRANRQLEFTQIDVEMSFITPEDLYEIIEGMMCAIYKELKGIELSRPFPRLSYAEAMLKYGNDHPDMRFGMEIHDVTDVFRSGCEFKVFNTIIEGGSSIRGITVPGCASWSRKKLDELTPFVAQFGAKGVSWLKVDSEEKVSSPIAKFLAPDTVKNLIGEMEAAPGDLILLVADMKESVIRDALANLRLRLGKELDLIDESAINLCWIVDFPMFEWNETEERWDPAHHPFTSPVPEDIPLLETEPGKARAIAYDLVLNGEEIGGGSIRIHREEVQEKVFRSIGITPEQARQKFGFLLDALKLGAPPHGGIAFGLDRIIMILCGEDSIRDVIAFPKTQTGVCPMTSAPSPVDDQQYKDLHIKSAVEDKKEEEDK